MLRNTKYELEKLVEANKVVDYETVKRFLVKHSFSYLLSRRALDQLAFMHQANIEHTNRVLLTYQSFKFRFHPTQKGVFYIDLYAVPSTYTLTKDRVPYATVAFRFIQNAIIGTAEQTQVAA